jgi:hypothetical protein
MQRYAVMIVPVKKTEQKRAALQEKIDAGMSIEQAADALAIPRSTAFRIMKGLGPGRWPEPVVADTLSATEPTTRPNTGQMEPVKAADAPVVVRPAGQPEPCSTSSPAIHLPVTDEYAKRRAWRQKQLEAHSVRSSAVRERNCDRRLRLSLSERVSQLQ